MCVSHFDKIKCNRSHGCRLWNFHVRVCAAHTSQPTIAFHWPQWWGDYSSLTSVMMGLFWACCVICKRLLQHGGRTSMITRNKLYKSRAYPNLFGGPLWPPVAFTCEGNKPTHFIFLRVPMFEYARDFDTAQCHEIIVNLLLCFMSCNHVSLRARQTGTHKELRLILFCESIIV